MNKCTNITLPLWITSRWEENRESWDVYDILSWFLQIPLQALFLLGASLLSVQVMWRKLFPIYHQHENVGSQELLKNSKLRSFTLKELRQYDGVQDSRIYVAVNGKVFDVTNTKGTQYVDGPFNAFAGRDASRALATFSLDGEPETSLSGLDDLLDLNPLQMESLFDWEMQYLERHSCVGRLVKSHKPCGLQQACLTTVRVVMGCKSCHKGSVDELPLPRLIRTNILACGKDSDCRGVRFSE